MDDSSTPSSPSDSYGGFTGEQESVYSELSEKVTARLKQPFAELSSLAELSDTESEESYSSALESPTQHSHDGFPGEQESVDSELSEKALRLIAHLKQPFRAFLLAQKYGEEYTRIMSDRDIIAQVKNTTSVRDMMHCVRTVEVV
ncbi:uncharacterized protein BJ212DRAFT_1299078 [Suillus subaureus]|uniref:Uncharacterized protein n=1 Tax=Suillus subaureus TaxID=48587 RepID=A0A9P7JEG1_9AGAM|nr:uncharacterized protein BJ212DRAFT_1299078 [Suillus subaureus]KAG1817524.1 hypothetical protein BJ212DRAFT_1299078 [Suillus subaureus]